ncbi:MAG: thymidine kinase [Nannocystaceae bacterium]
MAKLYFRHGTMDSAKTLNLLAVAHNYRSQGKKVLLLKPRLDDRFGDTAIASRAGIQAEADLLLDRDAVLDPQRFVGVDCVLVDEAQFLSARVIEQLRRLTKEPGLPVICYGLRTDFRTRLFEGSRRLLELADSIEEVKVTCQFCNRKAILNLRLRGGAPSLDGDQIELGGNDRYAPVCYVCYERHFPIAGLDDPEAR